MTGRGLRHAADATTTRSRRWPSAAASASGSGLGRTRALLRELGDPQLAVRGALVAGTNGKGSVLALAGSALRAAGLRVGETPKPHLVSYRERIAIDGRPIDADDFTRHVAGRARRRRSGRAGGTATPTEFELLTAVVFRHFAEADLDVALVEVGLGGRLDATHAWDGGVAASPTSSSTTWTGWARRSRPSRRRRPRSSSAATSRSPARPARRWPSSAGGPGASACPLDRRRAGRRSSAGTATASRSSCRGSGATRVGLRGRHQAANVAVADAILDALEAAGHRHGATTPPAARGYARRRWPGRLELLDVDGREVLLDGAHNPAGAAALATALDDLRPFLAAGSG